MIFYGLVGASLSSSSVMIRMAPMTIIAAMIQAIVEPDVSDSLSPTGAAVRLA